MAATDFSGISTDDLSRLSVWLVVTGCCFGAFHGVGSERAEGIYDEAVVIVELALGGESDLRQEISEVWPRPLDESAAADVGVAYMSTSHRPECESLGDLIELGFLSSEPLERAIALPLDAASAAALSDVLAI